MMAGEQVAIDVGENYVKSHYADFRKDDKKPVVRDMGGYWEFTYQLPEGMLGGAPVVIIEKNTLSIIRSYRTQ